MQSSLDVPRAASRASSRAGTPIGPVRATLALDGSPLALKCPLPASAFQGYDNARGVRMQWFRDGTELYDSGPRAPAFFITEGVQFRDGNTEWRAGIVERKSVVLSTQRVRSVDAGRYTCRVYIDADAYESSGKLISLLY